MHTFRRLALKPKELPSGGRSAADCVKCGHFDAYFFGNAFRLNNFLGSFDRARYFSRGAPGRGLSRNLVRAGEHTITVSTILSAQKVPPFCK